MLSRGQIAFLPRKIRENLFKHIFKLTVQSEHLSQVRQIPDSDGIDRDVPIPNGWHRTCVIYFSDSCGVIVDVRGMC